MSPTNDNDNELLQQQLHKGAAQIFVRIHQLYLSVIDNPGLNAQAKVAALEGMIKQSIAHVEKMLGPPE